MKNRNDPVGDYFGQRETSWQRLVRKLMVGHTLRGARMDPNTRLPLTWSESPFVKGLREFSRAQDECHTKAVGQKNPLVVGTIRMGFGHHRIAYSAYTWALAQGATPYLHDVLGIESPGAEVVRRLDAKYSRLSRISSNLGGIVEWLWGKLMQQGGLGSLRMSCDLAHALAPLMRGIPKDIPVISSHPLNGQIALACGFERVINLVIDNHPQYFILVPGALNLVQSPYNELRFLEMGVPRKDLALGGHWVSQALVEHAAHDSALRIEGAEAKRPRRLLVPVGGAGAQQRYLESFLEGLGPRLKEGSLRVFLNVGDHAHMAQAMQRCLNKLQLPHKMVSNHQEVTSFCEKNALDRPEPDNTLPVTLFRFQTHFEAFSTTDLLQRCADILVTKPSELAFFPIPKLHIRRVGNHEAAAAQRAAELGDGTCENRTVAEALHLVELLCDHDKLFVRMNEHIAKNACIGIYDGSRIAVERALHPTNNTISMMKVS